MYKVYYNEIDQFLGKWLKNLMNTGQIPVGDIDTRPIQQVSPKDLVGYTQLHFFAGISGWAVALKMAGISEDTPLWTGSPPCQPFSTAGKQKGQKDERHLAPYWLNLIRECKPELIFGEQVESALSFGWWDDVADDLEGQGYEVAAAVLPACSVGTPHRRNRLFFVAHNQDINYYNKDIYLKTTYLEKNDEIVQEMWDNKTTRKIFKRTEGKGWSSPLLQGLSEYSKDYLLCEKQRENNTTEQSQNEIATRIGKKVQNTIQNDEQSKVVDSKYDSSSQKERNTLRYTELRERINRKNEQGSMRNDGTPIKHESPKYTDYRHSFNRQDRPSSRLHLCEHSNCMLGNECGDGDMGRTKTSRIIGIMDKEQLNDITRTTINKVTESSSLFKSIFSNTCLGNKNDSSGKKIFKIKDNTDFLRETQNKELGEKYNRRSLMGDTKLYGFNEAKELGGTTESQDQRGLFQFERPVEPCSMGNTKHNGLFTIEECRGNEETGNNGRQEGKNSTRKSTGTSSTRYVYSLQESQSSFWDGEWLNCPDGKRRIIGRKLYSMVTGISRNVAGLLSSVGEQEEKEVVNSADIVNYLTSQLSLGYWASQTEDTIPLKDVLISFGKIGSIPETVLQAKEIWESIDYEKRRRIVNNILLQRSFYWGNISLLTTGELPYSREIAIKGFGNAIVPQVAANFMACSLDAINDKYGL